MFYGFLLQAPAGQEPVSCLFMRLTAVYVGRCDPAPALGTSASSIVPLPSLDLATDVGELRLRMLGGEVLSFWWGAESPH